MEYEEPRVDRALDKVMKILDEEVPKSIAVTRADELHSEAAFAGEPLLEKPENEDMMAEIQKARMQTEIALHGWITAWNNLSHHGRD